MARQHSLYCLTFENVYFARNARPRLDWEVALKALPAELPSNQRCICWFVQEAYIDETLPHLQSNRDG